MVAKRLRVGMISPGLCTGGVERWWLSLCRFWERSTEIAVSGIALTDGAYAEQAAVDEIARYGPVYGSEALDTALNMNADRNIERYRSGWDAVHVLKQYSDVLIVWGHENISTYISDFTGPVVMVSHGSGDWTKKQMAHAAYYVTHLAAVSQACLKAYPEDLQLKVHVILNGIELDRCAGSRTRKSIRAEWGLADTDVAVGYVGRYSHEKVPMAAARAVAGMSNNAVAVYVGPDFKKPDVQQVIREQTKGACRFVAPPHIGDAFSGLDVLMIASSEEGCCLVLLEAMAAGLPVVATPVGAVPELEAQYGQLVQRVDVNASDDRLVSAVYSAIGIGAKARTARAREIAMANFSAARMAQDWTTYLLALRLKSPTVAVGITCHNYGRYLAEAIESVLDQTHEVDEIVVVDDGSTDNTAMVVRDYLWRGVKYVKIDIGNATGSRGAAFEHTTADIVCFLDADDKLAPDYISEGLPLFADRHVGVVSCDVQNFGDNAKVWSCKDTAKIDLWVANACCVSSLVRRTALDHGGIFDDWQAWKGRRLGTGDLPAEDWIMFRTLVDAGWKVAFSDSQLLHRCHAASKSARWGKHGEYYHVSNLAQAPVTFLVLLSSEHGWFELHQFLDNQRWSSDQARLIICTDERNLGLIDSASGWMRDCPYMDIRYVLLNGNLTNAVERARAYNRLIREVTTEYVLLLDGMTKPPIDIVEQYLRSFDWVKAIRTHTERFVSCGMVRKSVLSQVVWQGEDFEQQVINTVSKTYNFEHTFWGVDTSPLKT